MTVIWTCTIGHNDIDRDTLPPACDYPMRQAVASAFRALTGFDDEFLFSGWGTLALTESQQAVVDHRLPDHTAEEWSDASAIVDGLIGDAELDLSNFTHDSEVVDAARSALVELLAHVRRARQVVS